MCDKRFRQALDFVLACEGGYVNNPNDLGGETNFGITTRTYSAYRKSKGLCARSVKEISMNEIEEIYYKKYYIASGANKIEDFELALVHFDTAVNMGISRANNFLTLSHSNVEEYLRLRRAKYIEFAKIPSQKVFLRGWLNRVAHLESYIKTISKGEINV